VKLAWATDLHLDMVNRNRLEEFVRDVKNAGPVDGLLLTGDISTALRVKDDVHYLHEQTKLEVYYVLGNHDFWVSRGTSRLMAETRASLKAAVGVEYAADIEGVLYLSQPDAILTMGEVSLIGEDGWYDGRYGHATKSIIGLNDWVYIKDFFSLKIGSIVGKSRSIADAYAASLYIKACLALADGAKTLVVATHVPPFRECATYRGVPSDDEWAPWFVSKATGDVLLQLATDFPDRRFEVFCGHSHGGSDVQVRENLRVRTGAATYGQPRLQGVFEF
jgi:predicted phosphohydrolase